MQHTKELIQQTFGRVPRSDNQPSPAAGAWNAQLLARMGGAAAAAGAGAPSSSSSNGAPAAAAAEAEDAEGAASTSGSGMASGALLDNLPKQKGMVGHRLVVRLVALLLPCCRRGPLLRAWDWMPHLLRSLAPSATH